MKEAEFSGISDDSQKLRMRLRCQGIDPDLLETVPAKPAPWDILRPYWRFTIKLPKKPN